MTRHWSIRAQRLVLAPAMALALLLFASGTPAAEPRVLVLNDTNEPPFTTAEKDGFLDLVAGEAFRRAGLELRLVKLPAERALTLANEGIEDGDLSRIAGLEMRYPNLVRVPELLCIWTFSAFSKNPKLAADIATIRGRTTGLIRGWKIYEVALAGADKVLSVDDPAQLFRLLERDRIEVALYGRQMGLSFLQRNGIRNVSVLEPPLYTREMFVYLHKRHAAHIPAITAALRAMKHDGSYARAQERTLVAFERKATP